MENIDGEIHPMTAAKSCILIVSRTEWNQNIAKKKKKKNW